MRTKWRKGCLISTGVLLLLQVGCSGIAAYANRRAEKDMVSKVLRIVAGAEEEGSQFQDISGQGANQCIFSYQVRGDLSEKTLRRWTDDKGILESPGGIVHLLNGDNYVVGFYPFYDEPYETELVIYGSRAPGSFWDFITCID